MDEATFLALPEAQRKALQGEWRAQGIYAGPLDGRSGDGVRSALRSLTTQRQQNQQYDLERMRLEQQGNEAAANRQREERAAQERQQREAGADPMTNIAIPMGLGAGVGMGASYGLNSIVGAGDRARVRAINEIGDEIGPTRDLTASQTNRARAAGAAKAAERFAPATGMGKLGAALKRIGSYGIPGGAVLNEYHRYDTIASDESKPWAERQAATRIANGLLGIGTGIIAEGGARALNPLGADGEGRSMMRIEAARDLARRMDAADAARPLTAVDPMERLKGAAAAADAPPALPPPEAAPKPPTRNSATLINAAKASGATGRLTKASAAEHLIANINDSNRGTIAKALGVSNGPNLHSRVMQTIKTMASKPGASAILAGLVGATAASTDPAEAGDGSAVNGLGNRAIAGGTAATGAYGLSRLVNALSPAAKAAIGSAGTMMTPMAAADAYDPTPTQLLQDRVTAGEYLPSFLRGGAIEDAYQMAQVPERGDRGDEAMLARARADQAEQMPLANAASLEMPPQTDTPDEFDQLVSASQDDPELAQMLRDAILARVQQANGQQIPNAMASQAVAARGGDPMANALRNFAQR